MRLLKLNSVKTVANRNSRRDSWRRPELELLEDRSLPDTTPATMLDPNLQVTTVVSTGITQPIGIVFLNANDFFVLEKASGQVKRVINGVLQATPALDLAVNSSSERGLLSMALHPNFPATPFVYIRWTESSTGVDSTVSTSVPLLGNRVDRYVWNGSTLTFNQSIIALRSLQTDNSTVTGHPGTNNPGTNGNHNGGVIKFGPDGKLYIFMGDQGRRGWMQNLPNGPFLTAPQVDDTFGGPTPDNAHLTGVILRLNDDGTTPTDNPFFAAGAALGGEAGGNIQKVYSYGHRNGFGMAFDPFSGSLWETENADDAYSELNRIVPGMNGGWIQFAGPISRISDFKFIETTQFGSALQQVRYPPTRVAYTATQALSQMEMLPGATYVDPEFSWRYEIGPAGTAFVNGNGLGSAYNGTLWIGSARSNQMVGGNGGSLYRLKLTSDRLHVDVTADPRLADHVADNLLTPSKFDGTESETLQIGTGFGITPDIEQGPDGFLYVVSNTDNVIYQIRPLAGRPAPNPIMPGTGTMNDLPDQEVISTGKPGMIPDFKSNVESSIANSNAVTIPNALNLNPIINSLSYMMSITGSNSNGNPDDQSTEVNQPDVINSSDLISPPLSFMSLSSIDLLSEDIPSTDWHTLMGVSFLP